MKRNQLFGIFILLFGYAIFASHSSGAGAVQNADRTGGPVSNGNCTNCHGGGDFSSSVDIAVIDENGDTVTAYVPETTYTLRIKVDATGAAAYGFQTVALDSENENAGEFGDAPDGTQITSLEDRDYFEHSQRSTTGEWEIEWTAPEDEEGTVGFWVAGNSVNNADGNQGDEISLDSLILEQQVVSSRRDVANFGLEVGPNPASQFVRATWDNRELAPTEISIMGMNGQQVATQTLQKGASESTLDILDFPAGIYILQLGSAKGMQSQKFLKR